MPNENEDGFSVINRSKSALGEELPFLSNNVIKIMAAQGIDGDVVANVARKLMTLPMPVSANDVVKTLGEQNERAYKVLMLFTRVRFEGVPMLRVGALKGKTYYQMSHAFDVNSVLIAFAFDRYLDRYDGWGVG